MTQRQRFFILAVAGWFNLLLGSGFAQKTLPDVHFEATPQRIVEEMLQMAKVNRNDMVYDLGCGDGRFVITAAKKYGARGVGIDIDPERIKESNQNARLAGVTDKVKFKEGDLFETSIREATVVTLYLLPDLNLELRPKLLKELRPGSRVVSYKFDMHDWHPDKMARLGSSTYYLWIIPAEVSGQWRWSLPSGRGKERFSMNLVQKFQEIEGMIKTPYEEISPLEAYVQGTRIGFLLRHRTPEHTVEMRYEGRVKGHSINGTVEILSGPFVGKHRWIAKRASRHP